MLKRNGLYRDQKDSVYEEWVYRDKKAEEQKAESVHTHTHSIVKEIEGEGSFPRR